MKVISSALARLWRMALGAAFLMLAGSWLVWLRPTTLGGPAAFIVVSGQSMEPTFFAGTLVMTQAQPVYGVGDVIAFPIDTGIAHPNAPLVIHRIVGGNVADGFVTQGDNMPLRDAWHVAPADVVGKAVFMVPSMGPALAFLRSPIFVASLCAGLATWTVLGLYSGGPRRYSGSATTMRRSSVMSSIDQRRPSRPSPESFTPPYGM